MITVAYPDIETEIITVPMNDGVRTRATIFTPTAAEAQLIIQKLFIEYGNVEFTTPIQCADGKWASTGIVWDGKYPVNLS